MGKKYPPITLEIDVLRLLSFPHRSKEERSKGIDAAVGHLCCDHYYEDVGDNGTHHYAMSEQMACDWLEHVIFEPLRELDAIYEHDHHLVTMKGSSLNIPKGWRDARVPNRIDGTKHVYTDYPLYSMIGISNDNDDRIKALWKDRWMFDKEFIAHLEHYIDPEGKPKLVTVIDPDWKGSR